MMAEHTFKTGLNLMQARQQQTIPFSAEDLGKLAKNARVSAFFSTHELTKLINGSALLEEVFFYPLLNKHGALTLGAVAVEGNQLDFMLASKEQETSSSEKLEGVPPGTVIHAQSTNFDTAATRDDLLSRFLKSQWFFSKVAFKISPLKDLLKDATGVTLYTSSIELYDTRGNLNTHYTLTAVPEKSTPADGVASLLPCPPNCGGGAYENKGFTTFA